jgi:hypothetical protein
MKARTGNTSPGAGPSLSLPVEPPADSELRASRPASPVVVTASRLPPPPVPELLVVASTADELGAIDVGEPSAPDESDDSPSPSESGLSPVSRLRPSAMKLARVPSPGVGPADRRVTAEDSRPSATRLNAIELDPNARLPSREAMGGSLSPAAFGVRARPPVAGRNVAISIGLLAGGLAAVFALSSSHSRHAIGQPAHASVVVPDASITASTSRAPSSGPKSSSASAPASRSSDGTTGAAVPIAPTSAVGSAPTAPLAAQAGNAALTADARAREAMGVTSGSLERSPDPDRGMDARGKTRSVSLQSGTEGKDSHVASELHTRTSRSNSPSTGAQTPNPHVPDDLFF